MSLEFVGHDCVRMGEGTWAWVKLEHFTFDVAHEDRAVLADLISCDPYAWDFATAPAPPHPLWLEPPRIHACWPLEAIAVDHFRPISAEDAISVIDTWVNENELLDSDSEQPEDVRVRLESVYGLLRSGSVLQLDNPGDDARVDGWVTGVMGFHEFVVLDRDGGSSHLIVASDD